MASTWKLDSGCPPKNCSATTSASPATAAPRLVAVRDHTSSISHGSHAHTLYSGHDSQDDEVQPEAETSSPASSAPRQARIASARPSKNVPIARANTFTAAPRRATTRTAGPASAS